MAKPTEKIKPVAPNTVGFTKKLRHSDIDVEIGDEKQPDFKPRLKLKKWNNEVNFSVGLISSDKNPKVTVADDLVEWSGKDYDAKFYPLDLGEDGGIEFEFTLRKKPKSNQIDLSIQAKGLEFHYQPPLTEQERLEMVDRPKNVEGSYAAYHSFKTGDYTQLGGQNYATGKAFHIYRPHAIDADGKETYADLQIDTASSVLTIIMPQSFLDTATYPIWVDPTFGYTSVGASSYSLDFTHGFGNVHDLPVRADVESISFYGIGSGSPPVQFGIYSSNNPSFAPGSTLTFVAGMPNSVTRSYSQYTWWTNTIPTVTLGAGSYAIYAIIPYTSTKNKFDSYFDTYDQISGFTNSDGFYGPPGDTGSLPATTTVDSSYGRIYSNYVTYTEAAEDPGGGTTTGQVKVYTGSAFTAKPVKVWDGSAWTTKPVKRWDGSAWVEPPY